jgi:hypothetical protein
MDVARKDKIMNFTEDDVPQHGSDGWYVVWQFDDEETGQPTDYAERFDTEAEAQSAIDENKKS